jgi:DNA-binding response OmpR family regulator
MATLAQKISYLLIQHFAQNSTEEVKRALVAAEQRLDLRAARLLRGSQPVPLRPKTFAGLRYLVRRRHTRPAYGSCIRGL